MKLLGIDFETTGLEIDTLRVIEVGACLWDTDLGAPVAMMNHLVYEEGYPNLEPIITEKTGITNEMLRTYGRAPVQVMLEFYDLLSSCQAAAAHNGKGFDFLILEPEFERCGIQWEKNNFIWVDTMTDVPYPESIKARNLVHLAAEHGFLNPFPHRALTDVLTMLKVMMCYPLETTLEYAQEPTVILKALVDFNEKDKAKERRYRWDGENKQWVKRVRVSEADREEVEAGFLIERMEDDGRKI